MTSDVNFSLADAYEEFGDELLPKVIDPGNYTAEVTSAAAAVTSGGKQCIKLVLKVIEGPEVGTTLPDQLTWSPESKDASRIFSQSLAILGAEPSWVKENRPTMDEIANRIVGSVVEIRTTIRQFNGQDRANVNYRKTISTAADGTPAPPALLGVIPTPSEAPAAPAQAPAQAAAPAGFQWPSPAV